jgi:hypothetical protein
MCSGCVNCPSGSSEPGSHSRKRPRRATAEPGRDLAPMAFRAMANHFFYRTTALGPLQVGAAGAVQS